MGEDRDVAHGDENGDGTSGDRPLAAVVPKAAGDAAIRSLRAEGVYDEGRRVVDHGPDAIAVPVTAHPRETRVRTVVRQADPEPRLRTLADLLADRGFTDAEIERAPSSWAVVGSVVLARLEGCPRPAEVGEALLELHGGADTAVDDRGIAGRFREPDVRVVAGEGDTETVHVEAGTRYALDVAEVMFSPGNQAERVRMGEAVAGDAGPAPETDAVAGRAGGDGGGVDADDPPDTAGGDAPPAERALDMFAGIGYFALPMARAGARVTAVEANPTAFRYLLENAALNGVTDRVEPYRGDCQEVVGRLAADGPVADRVVMGYLDAYEYLDAALPAVAPGGVVHLHEATPEPELWDRPVGRLEAAANAAGRGVVVLDRRRVKSYSEGVAHVVVDARVD